MVCDGDCVVGNEKKFNEGGEVEDDRRREDDRDVDKGKNLARDECDSIYVVGSDGDGIEDDGRGSERDKEEFNEGGGVRDERDENDDGRGEDDREVDRHVDRGENDDENDKGQDDKNEIGLRSGRASENKG